MKLLVTFLFFLNVSFMPMQACRWCFVGSNTRIKLVVNKVISVDDFKKKPTSEPVKFEKNQEQKPDSKFEIDQKLDNEPDENFDPDLEHDPEMMCMPDGSYQPTQQGKIFYKQGIYDHYPKAFVLRYTYFPTMCPKAIDIALREVVNVMTFDDWFFFGNKKKNFNWGQHWERVVTVCKILNNFFNKAYYDRNNLEIYEKNNKKMQQTYVTQPRDGILLRTYMAEQGLTAVHDFYALYFDYVVKLFNEGIKFRDRKKINKYYYVLRAIKTKLSKSKHKAKYTNALERSVRLRKLFLEEDKQRKSGGKKTKKEW